MNLTSEAIRALEPTGVRYEVSDGSHPLSVEVSAKGVKRFYFRGRLHGKSKRTLIGRAKDNSGEGWITLTEARKKAEALKVEYRSAPGKVSQSVSQLGVTVADAFTLYMNAKGGEARTAHEKWLFYRRVMESDWATRPLVSISRLDAKAILDAIYARLLSVGKKGVGGNRDLRQMSAFFNWCATDGMDDCGLSEDYVAPTAKLKARIKEHPRSRVLSERELVWLFGGLGELRQTKPRWADALESLLRCVCRRADLFNTQWGWIDDGRITVPSTKNETKLLIPVVPQVAVLIGGRPVAAQDSDRVWVNDIDTLGSDSLDVLRPLMTRIARAEGFSGDFQAKGPHRFSVHDLRTAATTWLSATDENDDQRCPDHIIERLLNHKDESVKGRHYNFHSYYKEKKLALIVWNEHLDKLKLRASAKS